MIGFDKINGCVLLVVCDIFFVKLNELRGEFLFLEMIDCWEELFGCEDIEIVLVVFFDDVYCE